MIPESIKYIQAKTFELTYKSSCERKRNQSIYGPESSTPSVFGELRKVQPSTFSLTRSSKCLLRCCTTAYYFFGQNTNITRSMLHLSYFLSDIKESEEVELKRHRLNNLYTTALQISTKNPIDL